MGRDPLLLIFMNNILLILRKSSDVSFFRRYSTQFQGRVIAAVEDPLVYALAKESDYIQEVRFIEKMDSVCTCIETVQEIRNVLNNWLVKHSPGLPAYLLEWENWAEGGDTTQKIQDLVLLIQSYRDLLSDNVTKMVLKRSREYWWEDDVLVSTAKNLKIEMLEKKGIQFRLFQFLQGRIRGNARLLYWVGRVLLSKFYRRDGDGNQNKKVVFLLESSVDKHVNNIVPVMREFSRRGGYESIALCWHAFGGFKKIKKQGFKADNLERWCPLTRLPLIVLLYLKIRWRFWIKYYSFHESVSLKYQDISLNNLVFPFVKIFLQELLVCRVMLFFAAKSYLKQNNPVAVKTWGDNILDFGRIFYRSIGEKYNQSGNTRPTIFFYPVGLAWEVPYVCCSEKSDLVFVAGEIDKKIEAKNLPPQTKIVVSGFARSTELVEFRKKNSVETSRKILGVTGGSEYTVFFPSLGVIRGIYSAQERNIVISQLVGFVKKRPEISLVIKPYPTEPVFFWKRLISRLGNPKNIFLTDRSLSPYHCINVSDLMITKLSTLVMEAMEFEKPVVSVVLDNEPRFLDLYGEGVEKITDLPALETLLNHITSDRVLFSSWSQSRLEKQKEFLPKKSYPSQTPVEKTIVDEVIKML